MHREAYDFVARCLADLPPRERVVEIGGRDVNGSVRRLFGAVSYVSVDLVTGRGVDLVADGAEYQPEEAPDAVVCCEVLEHAENASGIVANAHRILAPGGILILTGATTGRVPHGCDGGPVGDEFYRHVNADELEAWLSPFEWHKIEIDPDAGDIRAMALKGEEAGGE